MKKPLQIHSALNKDTDSEMTIYERQSEVYLNPQNERKEPLITPKLNITRVTVMPH